MSAELLERFEREAQLLARVHHENVVAVFDSGTMADGSPYLVLQRLQGESLAARLLGGPLPMAEVVCFTRQILSALSALSDAGITHRDVKPDNLVLDQLADGRTVVKLVDFGIAKDMNGPESSHPEELVGTPNYMAPEQVRGGAVDARCDVYALGATVYEMLTGRTPHVGETVEDVARATLFAPITPVGELRLDCPEKLEQIVMKALARDPNERFASAREMKLALDVWEATEQPVLLVRPARPRGDEDTLRIAIREGKVLRARSKARQLGLAAVACLAALSIWAGVHHLQTRDTTKELVAQGAPQASQIAEQASALGIVVQKTKHARAALEQAGTSAAELWTRVRAGTHELLELARHSARAWTANGSRRER